MAVIDKSYALTVCIKQTVRAFEFLRLDVFLGLKTMPMMRLIQRETLSVLCAFCAQKQMHAAR